MRRWIAYKLIQLSRLIKNTDHTDYYEDEHGSIMVSSNEYGYGMQVASGKYCDFECFDKGKGFEEYLDSLDQASSRLAKDHS